MESLYIALAILSGLIFLAAGLTKALGKREALLPRMAWMADFPPVVVRLIGVAEALGGVALIVSPWVLPVLGFVAAICLAVTMILAIVVHLRRREGREVLPAVVLLVLLAVLIVIGASGVIA